MFVCILQGKKPIFSYKRYTVDIWNNRERIPVTCPGTSGELRRKIKEKTIHLFEENLWGVGFWGHDFLSKCLRHPKKNYKPALGHARL